MERDKKIKLDFDSIHQIRVKQLFMTQAISQLWGSRDSLYGEDVVFGCKLLMHDIQADIAEVERLLEEKTLTVK
jgi:hypothetical protein